MKTITKVLMIISLIAGAVLGFGIDYLITTPKIKTLSSELNLTRSQLVALQAEFTELSGTHDELVADYGELEEQYAEFSENSVPLEEYDDLHSDYDELLDENEGLQSELSLERARISELNSTYQTLTDQYDELREEYDQYVLPLSAQSTINNLEITLTIDNRSYGLTEPVTGTVSIRYGSGEPFRGNITFSIKNLYFDVFAMGYQHSIVGETDYSISGALRWGVGRYSIGLKEIIDDNGSVIAAYNDLKDLTLLFDTT